jgi:L-lactate dehydrogenase complex protein LldG
MEESTSREKVLKKVRNALIYKTDNPFQYIESNCDIYKAFDETADVTFAYAFTKAGGKFLYCENEIELIQVLKTLVAENSWQSVFTADAEMQYILNQAGVPFQCDEIAFGEMQVAISSCEALIARTGSIMVSSKSESGRRLNAFAPVHIVIAWSNQLVDDINDAISMIRSKYSAKIPSFISFITGPSRTADIEKTLVMGAHGPKELFVLLVDESLNKSEI